jgi:hypothetical protein
VVATATPLSNTSGEHWHLKIRIGPIPNQVQSGILIAS